MSQAATPDLRYPIGPYVAPEAIAAHDRAQHIQQLDELPTRMRDAVKGLNAEQLDTPYRPAGWTVRQVVHHVPDSHLNAYVRFKLALTEDAPTIQPYDQEAWAALPDNAGPVDDSLDLLEALHGRWVRLLRDIAKEAWDRTYFHPETQTHQRLDQVLDHYAWHGAHHVAHVTALRQRKQW